jgi:PAS domain S-box-containing protein
MTVAGKMLLLVEDETVIAMAEADKLESIGYRVIIAGKGEDAIRITDERIGDIDLILMDIDLGKGIDGTEAARTILARHDIPVVFLSSHTEPEIVEKTESITSYGYVLKNSAITVIDASIKMAFKLFEAHRSLRKSEEALSLSEERYSIVFKKAPIVISISDMETGTFIDVNEQGLALSQFSRDELIGKRSVDVNWITKKTRDEMLFLIQRDGKISNYEIDMLARNGTVRSGIMNGEVIVLNGRKSLLLTVEDITEMKQAQNNFENIFNIAPNAITISRLSDRTIIHANPAFSQFTGYTIEEYAGKTGSDLDLVVHEDRFDSILETFTETGSIADIEITIRSKDGTLHQCIFSANKFLFNGEPAILAIIQDISEQKMNEKIISENRELYRTLIETTGTGYVTLDDEGKVIDANITYVRMTGHSFVKEIFGRSVIEWTAPHDVERNKEAIQRTLKQGYIRNLEIDYLHRDGTTDNIEINASVTNLQGVKKIITLCRDISEKKCSEKIHSSTDSELNNFFNLSLDLLCIADTEGNFIKLNPEWSQVLGYKISELEGHSFLDCVHPDDMQPTLDAVNTLSKQNELINFINRFRCKDGSYKWIEWRSHPEGKLVYAAARDVTERIHNGQKLELLLEQKETLMKELQHRVKNSLSLICGLLSLEKNKSSDTKIAGIFEDTINRIQSIASAYEKLYMSDDFSSIDLKIYISDIASSVRKSFIAAEPNASIVLDLDSACINMKRAVPLGMILNELITNGLKYAYPNGTKGDLRIKLKRVHDTIILSVSDNGIGYPEGFDPKTASSMGMLLIRMLADQINGKLSFNEEKGGVTVSIAIELNG